MDGETRNTENYSVPAVVRGEWGIRNHQDLTDEQKKYYPYYPMPDAWQWFLWNLWDWASDYKLPAGKIESFYTKPTNSGTWAKTTQGSLTNVYVTMIEKSRSHSDSYPPEVGARDIVTQRNMLSKNYQWLLRPTTGALCKVIADLGSEWLIETLDITKPPPLIVDLKVWQYCWATEVSPTKLPDGRYTVSDYAFVDQALKYNNPNSPRTGTPIPFVSIGGAIRLNKRGCKVVENGAKWSPYAPEK